VTKAAVRLLTFLVLAFGVVVPLHAQEAAQAAGGSDLVKWSIITGGFALAIAASFGALAQARGLSAATEGIARNPAAAGEIRGQIKVSS